MSKDKKRIELHCHSKHGGFATMYPGELVRYFSDEGMPAFAVTDESCINAFPELDDVYKIDNYSARPIYGMEAIVDRKYGKEVDYISVLIKNEKGKKAVYKIISKSQSKSAHPVYKFEDFIENREGLLLGTGTEKGRAYKLVISNESDDVIKEELKLYDYVEVLPYKRLIEANIRLINLADELGIPVVAISNARYVDKEGMKALQVMNYWNGKEEDVREYKLLSTEKMLEAFDFLPDEKAYEIVVENTYKIADMCESIPVLIERSCFPKLDNAKERLRAICLKEIEKRYGLVSDEVTKRLEFELNALEFTELESYLLVLKELLDKVNLTADDISVRGTSAGSFILYLLGISNIDPIKYGIQAETIFALDGDRRIDVDINIPKDRYDEILDKVSEVEGVGGYVWVGCMSSILESLAEAMLEKYMEENEIYAEEFDKVKLKIEGNYTGRNRHPVGILLLPKGLDCIENMPIARTKGDSLMSYFGYLFTDIPFVKSDLLTCESLEMLHKLSKKTGVNIGDVPIDDEEVIKLFSVDEDGNATGCSDIPEFKSEYTKRIIEMLNPKTFNDFVKISALSHGTDVWINNEKDLVFEKGLGIDEIIACRDDIFDYVMSLGIDRKTAFRIMESVRKGIVYRGRRAAWQNWKKELLNAGAKEWFIEACEKIRYLFPRAHAISYVIMSMRLGWFKIHYPNEFREVVSEYEEEF